MVVNMWKGIFFVLCSLSSTFGKININTHQVGLYLRESESQCHQTTPDCKSCLSQPQCSWCSNGITAKCTTKYGCSQKATVKQCEQPLNNFEDFQAQLDLVRHLYSPPSLTKLKPACSERRNCSFCTDSLECTWCENKKTCFPYFGQSNASEVCGSELWYKNQCLYSSMTKPCRQRTGGCKDCLSDKLCYWCKSSGNCSYFPYDAYKPTNCPADNYFHESCSHMSFWVVLSPILALLLAPFLIFLILFIVLWCMKRMGVEMLDDDEEKKKEEPSEKKKPSMKLSHKPSESRVEELKKKYNLGE